MAPNATFDGRPVVQVSIAARPSVDLAALRLLIKQKAGQPFSNAAVEESVAALEQLHEFSGVEVSVNPDATGLGLLFVLQPADYIGMLSFPGAERFPYTELLQAANLPQQTPYTPEELAAARQGLLAFFASQGYFLATVDSTAQFDDAHRIANVTFRVNLNERARIGAIEIQGIPPQQAQELRNNLASFWEKLKRDSLESGHAYSKTRLDKATNIMQKALGSSGRLTPNVRLDPPIYTRETNRADIRFEVQQGVFVSVKTEGANVSQGTLRRLIPIFTEGATDQDLIDEGRRNLASYLQSKGYFDVKVDSQVQRQPDRVNVVYDLDLGSRDRITGIRFRGNQFFTDGQLSAALQIKENRFHFFRGKYSTDLLSRSVDGITALYKNAGFSSVLIVPQVQGSSHVSVTFLIREGPRDRVNALRIVDSQDRPVQAGTVSHALNLGPGKPYSPRLLQQDRNQILGALLDSGFLNPQFSSRVTAVPGNPHSLDVVYVVDSGPRTDAANIVLLGNRTTRSSFIQGILGSNVRQGRPISESKFLTAESDLYRLGTFDWASIQPLQPAGNQTRDEVLATVHETPRNTVEFGVGLEVIPRSGNVPVGAVALPGLPPIGLGSHFTTSQKNFFGPRGSVKLDRRNIRGRAETASLSLVASRLDQQAEFTYADPYLHGTTWSSLFSLSDERSTENPIFTAAVASGAWQIEKALNQKRTQNAILRYDYQKVGLSNITIPDLVLPQDQHVRLSTVSGEYIHDTRDNPLDARHGLYQTIDVGITTKTLGSSATFLRVLGQNAFYVPVRPWLVWANNFRLGFDVPFAGSDVPLSERFFSGGVDSLRGFPVNGAGPQRPVQVCGAGSATNCTLISVPVGGNMLFIVNSELRFPLPVYHDLAGVVFYDGGNVYASSSFTQFADDFTHSVGLGLRYKTPVGPVRFDVGYRLTSVPGVRAIQYFVSMGQMF